MKKVIKYLLRVVLGVGAIVFIALLVLIRWPNILIGPGTLPWLQQVAHGRGIDLKWTTASLDVYSQSWFGKQVEFHAENFCYEATNQKICFREVDVEIAVSLSYFSPKITTLGPIALLGGTIEGKSISEKNASTKSSSSSQGGFLPEIPSWLVTSDLHRIAIEVDKFQWQADDNRVEARAKLAASGLEAYAKWKVDWKASLKAPKTAYQGSGQLTLESEKSQWRGPWRVTTVADAKLGPKEKAALKLNLSQTDRKSASYDVKGNYVTGEQKIELEARGEAGDRKITARLNGTGSKWVSALPRIFVHDCELSLTKNGKRGDGRFKMDCPAGVEFALPKASNRVPDLRFLQRPEVAIKADLATGSYLPSADTPVEGTVQVDFSRLRNALIQGRGNIVVNAKGKPSELFQGMKLDTVADFGLSLEQFEKLAAMTRTYPSWAVPEPFNSMSGKVDLDVKAKGELPWQIRALPVTLTTHLHSRSQRFETVTRGQIEFKETPSAVHTHLALNSELSDVVLVLPHLPLGSPPRFFPDPRISRASPEESDEPSTFTYDIKVQTPQNHPLRLRSNLAKREIPIKLNVAATSDKPTLVQARIESFPLQLFRRNATVEYFTVKTSADQKDLDIQGEIRVTYTDYVIRVNLRGTTDLPEIDISSTPPLPESQLYAVLLFGRPLEQLEPGQMESVGNARAALAEGAISLASMYILASTPIESVGYNQGTGVMTAKVKLSDGTSLNLGTDFKQLSQVGVRKRLGPNWSINTYVENPMDTVNRTLNAFLEWNKKY